MNKTPYKFKSMNDSEFEKFLNTITDSNDLFYADEDLLDEVLPLLGNVNIECWESVKSQLASEERLAYCVSNLTSAELFKKVEIQLSSLDEANRTTLEALIQSENTTGNEVIEMLKLFTAFPVEENFSQSLLSNDVDCDADCGTANDASSDKSSNTSTNVVTVEVAESLKQIQSTISDLFIEVEKFADKLDMVKDEAYNTKSIASKLHQQITQTKPIKSSYTKVQMNDYVDKVMDALDSAEKKDDLVTDLLDRLIDSDGPLKEHTIDTMVRFIQELTGISIDSDAVSNSKEEV